jgi:hypothetical protein
VPYRSVNQARKVSRSQYFLGAKEPVDVLQFPDQFAKEKESVDHENS